MRLSDIEKLDQWAWQQRFDDYLRGVRINVQIAVNYYCVWSIHGQLEVLPFRWARNARLITRGDWQNRIKEATR